MSRSAQWLNLLLTELKCTWRNPKRIASLFNRSRLMEHWRAETDRLGLHDTWSDDPRRPGWRIRDYDDDESYRRHQRRKLVGIPKEQLTEYTKRFRAALMERMADIPPAKTVLCLAARNGAEVMAFRDLGHLAIGVDLNPGENNQYVLPGDFHSLQFADHVFDILYSNSLDHVRDFDIYIAECKRLLKPSGQLLLEISLAGAGQFEALAWPSIEAVIDACRDKGFMLTARQSIFQPWPGEQIRFNVPD